MVAPLKATTVEGRYEAKVSAELPSSQKEKATKFNEMVAPILEGVEGFSNNVVAALNAGDMYETITNVKPIRGDTDMNLEHKEGEVWLVDFWATWCPPCQAPMAHNQAMLDKRKADWGDKVRIIGISIDQGAAEVVSHVDAKGWTSVEHYHRSQSKCSEVYKV